MTKAQRLLAAAGVRGGVRVRFRRRLRSERELKPKQWLPQKLARPGRYWTAPLLGLLCGVLPLHLASGQTSPLPSIVRSAPTGQQVVRLATYNLHNAFDVFDDPYTEDQSTRVKPRHEWEAIAHALRHMDADVIGVSEVENAGVLRAMIDELLPDMGYEYVVVLPGNDRRGIQVGLISRLPIERASSHRWLPLKDPAHRGEAEESRKWRFARDLLQVRVRLAHGQLLEVFVVHLKSRWDGENDPNSTRWRGAEARRIRQIVQDHLAEEPNLLAAVVGDFNADPQRATMQLLLAPASGDGQAPLRDVHALLPREERTTLPSRGRFADAIFDYILVSPALARRLVPGSANVLQHPDLTGGSDHRPLWADFLFPVYP